VRGNGAEYLIDLRPYTLRILNDLVRPEAHHAPAFALHGCRSARIGLDLKRMMIAVDLDHESPRYAGEVCEVRTYGILPPELRAAYAAIAQQFPDLTFGPAAIAAQFSCSIDGVLVSGHDPLT
jgi:hypothetical protein